MSTRPNICTASRPPWNDAELVGNQQVKEAVNRTIWWPGAPKAFVGGPSGSGKSCTLNFGFMALACHNPVDGAACGLCRGCQNFRSGHRNLGLFAYSDRDCPVPFHYLPLNCRNITSAALHSSLEHLRYMEGNRLIHLEEAVNLKRLGCDESVTDLMDDPDFADCRWFASAVRDHGLDFQFRRRWVVKVTTSPASPSEFASLLARRCRECDIEVDHPATIELLTQRSWRVVGLALAALDAAVVLGELTKPMVMDYPFPNSDPWQETFFET
jgi:hypothetical protein